MPEPAPARVIRLEAMSALTLAAHSARAEHRPAAMMMTGRRAMARGRRHRLKLTTAASISGQSTPSGLALQRGDHGIDPGAAELAQEGHMARRALGCRELLPPNALCIKHSPSTH